LRADVLASQPLRALSRLDGWLAREPTVPRFPLAIGVPLATAVLVGPVLAVALAVQEVSAIFWLALVLDLTALFAFAVVTWRRPVMMVGVIVLWFALQRLVIALLAPHVSADVVRLLLTYKEGFYLALLAAAGLTLALGLRRRERALPALLPADLAALALLGLLALHFVSSPGTSTPELTYLRRFAAPALIYLAGRALVPRRDQFDDSLRVLVLVASAVAVFGLVERFAFGVSFWSETVEAGTFYSKQIESGLLPEGWTVLYRGVPDGVFISLPLEVPVRRLVSSYLEPTTLGSFLALALLLAMLAPDGTILRKRITWATAVVIAVAVVATLSRAAMVTVIAGAGIFLLATVARNRAVSGSAAKLLLTAGVISAMGLGVAITTLDNPPAREDIRSVLSTRAVSGLGDEPAAPNAPGAPPSPDGDAPLPEIGEHPPGSTAAGASTHFKGLTSGLEQMLDDPLGLGLGAAGNWSRSPEVGGESTVGAVAAQLGVPGLLAFSAFFLAIPGSLLAVYWRRPRARGSLVCLALAGGVAGLFLVSFVTESASGLLGNAFYFLFAGWALAISTGRVNEPADQQASGPGPNGQA